jgi:benzodiazapine receptor
MHRFVKIFLNWLAVISVIAVNAMASISPINGLRTAEVSDKFPNHFVPAGYTFGVWIFIYLLHILFAGYTTYRLATKARAESHLGQLTQKIIPFFWLTCVLNISWIIAWHYLLIPVSLAIMIGLFLTLTAIFRIITISEKTLSLSYFDHVSLETPFIIYFSWIAIALLANLTAYLVSIGWGNWGFTEKWWSFSMIIVATIIGAWFSLYWHRPAYTAVIVWAVIGIYVKQADVSEAIKYMAITACLVCLPAAAIGFWLKRKLLFKTTTNTIGI